MNTFTLNTRRNIQACLIAPFSVFPAIFILCLALYIYSFIAGEKVTTTGLSVVFLFMFYGWLIALFATICFGVPIALALQKLGKFNLLFLLPCSLIPSLVIAFTNSSEVSLSLVYAYSSLCVAFSYWKLFNRSGI
jgi:hypothetical protein